MNINLRSVLIRSLVTACAVALPLSVWAPAQAPASEPDAIRMLVREMTPGSSLLHGAVYAEAEGTRMVSISPGRQSDDNGLTWTSLPPVPDFTAGLPYGYRRGPVTAAADPNTDRLVTIVNAMDTDGLDPGINEPPIALREYYLRYRVSDDGGRTWLFDEPMVNEGGGYTQEHPFEGMEIGTNAMYLGDRGSIPLVTDSGRILVPIQATIHDGNGGLWNPTGQYTYTEVFVAQGTWNEQSRLDWTASERVQANPSLSTRGMIEPTLAQFGDGRILMVMRGSNSGNYSLPSRRWYSVSQDDGDTWTDPQPWTYDDGQNFYSPSSMSTLITHSSGRVFWVGNLTPQNPDGNLPRYPVVVGEVDPNTLSLKRGSVVEVDGLGPEDAGRGRLDLSHFSIIEDRQTEELVLTYPRYHNSYSEAEWATIRMAINGFEVKESVDFDYKYEMTYLPSLRDRDGNNIGDFTNHGSSTVSGGILTMPAGALFDSTSSGIWQNTVNFDDGWTIEARVKVIDQGVADNVWEISAAAPGGSSAARLGVAENGQGWGNASSLKTIDYAVNNTDDFHVFRVVQHPGSPLYSVWRDGELIGESLSHVGEVGNYLSFGDGSGTTEVDYFRFTPGAYDPGIPDWHEAPPYMLPTKKNSSVFLYKYEFDADPTKASQIDLDGNSHPDWVAHGSGPKTLTEQGTLIIDSGPDSYAYYDSGIYGDDYLWPNVGFTVAEGFTIEWRMKVLSDTGLTAAFAMVVAAADNDKLPVLEIGDDMIAQAGENLVPDGMTIDNTDDFHTFRLVRDATDKSDKWWLWRDDELLTPTGFQIPRVYARNALYFGDIGGNYNGIVELDYFRLTPGAFAPGELQPLPGDANGDGQVDAADAAILADNWQTTSGATWAQGDFNGDGAINDIDATLLAANWQTGVAEAAVPEPSTLAMLLAALTFILGLRRPTVI